MEADLGTTLLERNRRGVELTPAGLTLLHHANLVLEQLEHMRGELNAYGRGLRTRVRLRSVTVGISEFLPARLASFLASRPNVDIDLEEHSSRDIVRAVAAGRAEIGVITEGADISPELETLPFADYRLVVAVPPKHDLRRRREVSFRSLLDLDLVGLRASSALQDWLGNRAVLAGKRMKLRLRLDGFDSVCRMVEAGIGVAIVPEPVARRWERSVRAVQLTDPWARRHLALCVRKRASLSPHAQSLATHLAAGPS
jgi:DNA-binding transcriptional LysR family regulator